MRKNNIKKEKAKRRRFLIRLIRLIRSVLFWAYNATLVTCVIYTGWAFHVIIGEEITDESSVFFIVSMALLLILMTILLFLLFLFIKGKLFVQMLRSPRKVKDNSQKNENTR